jgi:hypothetical protein
MTIAREIVRFGAATLALALMALSVCALVLLSFFMTYVPSLAMIAAIVFFAIPTPRSWRALVLAATAAAVLPPFSVALQMLRPRSGPPARKWEDGELVELKPPTLDEAALFCGSFAVGLFLAFLLAFFLWKRVVFPVPRVPMPPQSNRSYMIRFFAGTFALALAALAILMLMPLSNLSYPTAPTAVFFAAGAMGAAFLAAPDWRDMRSLALEAVAASAVPALMAGWLLLQPSGREMAGDLYGGDWKNPFFVAIATGGIAAALFLVYFAAFVLWKRVAFAR